jgi:hypothetical protein
MVFSKTEDSDYKGHSLLEQYAAQVSSALRPAFTPETPPDITGEACKVVAVWISSSVQKNAADLTRVHELLASLLSAIEQPPHPAYNERASTMLRLNLLKSYATLFIESETNESKQVLLPPAGNSFFQIPLSTSKC